MTLAAMLDDAAAKSPHAPAIHTSAGSLSYADLADRVARVAHGFMSLGLTGQDRVAIMLPNGVELAISILAASPCHCLPRSPRRNWGTSSGTAAPVCSSRRRHYSVP